MVVYSVHGEKILGAFEFCNEWHQVENDCLKECYI